MRCKGQTLLGKRCKKVSKEIYCLQHLPDVIVYNAKSKTCDQGDGIRAGYEVINGIVWKRLVGCIEKYKELFIRGMEDDFSCGPHGCVMHFKLYSYYQKLQIVPRIPKEVGSKRGNLVENFLIEFMEDIEYSVKDKRYIEVAKTKPGGVVVMVPNELYEKTKIKKVGNRYLSEINLDLFGEKYEEDDEDVIRSKDFTLIILSMDEYSSLKSSCIYKNIKLIGTEKVKEP